MLGLFEVQYKGYKLLPQEMKLPATNRTKAQKTQADISMAMVRAKLQNNHQVQQNSERDLWMATVNLDEGPLGKTQLRNGSWTIIWPNAVAKTH